MEASKTSSGDRRAASPNLVGKYPGEPEFSIAHDYADHEELWGMTRSGQKEDPGADLQLATF